MFVVFPAFVVREHNKQERLILLQTPLLTRRLFGEIRVKQFRYPRRLKLLVPGVMRGEEIFFDESYFEDGVVKCPNCGAKLEFETDAEIAGDEA